LSKKAAEEHHPTLINTTKNTSNGKKEREFSREKTGKKTKGMYGGQQI